MNDPINVLTTDVEKRINKNPTGVALSDSNQNTSTEQLSHGLYHSSFVYIQSDVTCIQ